MDKNLSVAILLNSPEMNIKISEEEVICADGGYRYANGKKVIAIVGDFDSLEKVPNNETVIRLEKEKNFTDGEQALRVALKFGYKNIVIYGAFSGKIEHILGNIALLKIAKELNLNAVIKDKNLTMTLISGKTEIIGKQGESLSIIPFGGECKVLNSFGLYYPLENLLLEAGGTRGISNILTSERVELEIERGEALVVHYF